MNKKLLATSLLSAAAFAGLAVGGTFALFTSNAEANIAIQTATVKYEASVVKDSLKTYSMDMEQTAAGAFENGGTAAISGNTLTLSNVTPGDKAEVEIKIVNTSTVKTAYRVVIRNQGDGKLPFNVTGEAASWVELAPSTNPSENVKVGVELPTTVGDDYQGKSYSLKIAVEAVQANATQVRVTNQSEFATAIKKAEEGTEIVLAPSETAYTVPSVSNKNITIVGKDTANTKVVRSEAVAVPDSSLTFKGVTMVGGTADYTGFQHISKEKYEDCVFTGRSTFYAPETIIKNCTFNQDVYDYHFWVYGKGTTKFEGCTFNNHGKAAKVYSEATEGVFNVEFKDCQFVSSENTHDKPAIAVNSLGATYNITVTHCTASNYNCNDDGMTAWYSTRMASATEAEKLLVGVEGQIDKVTATIDGKTY